jgi:hypothetical protein
MDELKRQIVAQAEKLDAESDHLSHQLEGLANGIHTMHLDLLVSQAKRARRSSTILVKQLAELRDKHNLQAEEATRE